MDNKVSFSPSPVGVNHQHAISIGEWVPVTLLNSWTKHSTTVRDPAILLTPDHFLHLQGAIKGGTTSTGSVLFNLPAWATPKVDAFPIVWHRATAGGSPTPTWLTIDNTGSVRVGLMVGNDFLSLDGVAVRLF